MSPSLTEIEGFIRAAMRRGGVPWATIDTDFPHLRSALQPIANTKKTETIQSFAPDFMNLLKDTGLKFKATSTHFHILEPKALLNFDALRSKIMGFDAHWHTHCATFFSTDSTNTQAFKLLEKRECPTVVCTAEHQSGGRGRSGRSWVSPLGRSIYLSLGHRFNFVDDDQELVKKMLASISTITLATGVIVADVLRKKGVTDIHLKWPNDLLRPAKAMVTKGDSNAQAMFGKVGGILCESLIQKNSLAVVLGIGINFKLNPNTAPTEYAWSDFSDHPSIDRTDTLITLVEKLLPTLINWQPDDFTHFKDQWNSLDAYAHRLVQITDGINRAEQKISPEQSSIFVGTNKGVSDDGSLMLVNDSETRLCTVGDVSLRPLHAE